MTEEQPLGGGRVTGAVRVGDTVRRGAGPWTPTIHAYLRHLEQRGFRGAPRVLGVDERGREVLSFVPGEVASSSSWELGRPTPMPPGTLADGVLVEVGTLIRELHDAARDFVPEQPVWREHDRPFAPGEIVCHGDLGPHNTIYREGRPVTFIDWDGARPSLPELEAAQAAWWFVPLADTDHLRAVGFAELPDVPSRLRLFCDAYGLAGADRILWLLQQTVQRSAERLRHWPEIDPRGAARILEYAAAQLVWLEDQTPALRRALVR
jgi:Ser/Thr protein kinase RdoA (MazF antagonist)